MDRPKLVLLIIVVPQNGRQDYNESRPHSSLGNVTPRQFAARSLQRVA